MASAKTKKAAAPPVEDDPELEELDADAEEAEDGKEEAETIWGVQDLCKLLKLKTGKEYKPREVRTLLRKMAREAKPRISRTIQPDNRSRYAWQGPEDPEVKRIIKAVTGGEIEQNKTEALAKLKSDKAAKTAAETPAKGGKKVAKTAKATKVVEADDEDLDDLDDEDDE